MSVKFNLGGINIADVAAAVSGRLYLYGNASEKDECFGIDIDSRNITQGDIFVAIRGERVDGNDYIKNAVENGAVLCIARSVPAEIDSINGRFAIVVCDDPTVAVGDLAKYYKKRKNDC